MTPINNRHKINENSGTCLYLHLLFTSDMILTTSSILDCGALSDPSNGAVILVTSTTYPSYAYYECDLGYTLSYTVTRACQLNGTWSYFAPVCDQSGIYLILSLNTCSNSH